MNHSPLLSIIIPTYKEAGNIKNLIEEILEYCDWDSLEILVVDDNSQDGIDEQIRLLYEQGINIMLLQRLENRGLATAVKFGMDRASGKYLVCMDADLSHPPAVIPKMLRVLEEQRAVEVVVGSRYVEEGGFAGEWSQYRQWNSKISTMLANLVIYDLGVKDPMSGYFCIRKEVYQRAAYIKPIGYKILLELLVKCGCSKVVEVPITFRERAKGESKLNLPEQMNYLNHLSRLFDFSHPQWSAAIKYLIVNVLGVSLMLLLWLILPAAEEVIAPVALSYLGVIATNIFFFGRYVHYNADQMKTGFPWISFTLITTAEYIFVLGFAFFVLNTMNMAGLLGLGALGALFRFMLRKLVGHDSRGPEVISNYKNSFNYSSEEVSCLGCGNHHFSYPYINKFRWLLQCKSCGFMFVHPQPTKEELDEIYSENYFDEWGSKEAKDALRKIKKQTYESHLVEIEKIQKIHTVLDIGCGLGYSLDAAKERGYKVTGVESNQSVVSEIRKRHEQVYTDLNEVLELRKKYDLVTLMEVLEHLPDLPKFFSQLHQMTHENSLVMLTTIDADSGRAKFLKDGWYHIHHDHLWYFTPRICTELFERNGFQVVCIKPADKFFTIRYIAGIISEKTRNKPINFIFNLVLKIFPKKLLDFNLPPQKEGFFLIAKKMNKKSNKNFLKMAL
jgi:glycosyltransferase involved in cell wall biosynthesis/SAM-dependent methyltransferase